MARVVGDIFSGRVLHFFGEALRQAGIPDPGLGARDLGPGLHPWATVRDRGRLLQPLGGRARLCGYSSAWCDLREIMPYAFGYMMSAKVGTGLVAEIGAMRGSRTRSTRSR